MSHSGARRGRRMLIAGVLLLLVTGAAAGARLAADNRAWETLAAACGVYRHRSVVLFGDSLMAQMSLARHFGLEPYRNRSVSGRLAADALNDLAKAAAEATDIVILLGTNDLGTGVSPEETVAAVERLGLAARDAGCRVVVCGVLPVYGAHLTTRSPQVLEYVNGELAAMCGRNGLRFAEIAPCFADGQGLLRKELSSDGLHLSLPGQALLAGMVRRAVGMEHADGAPPETLCGRHDGE